MVNVVLAEGIILAVASGVIFNQYYGIDSAISFALALGIALLFSTAQLWSITYWIFAVIFSSLWAIGSAIFAHSLTRGSLSWAIITGIGALILTMGLHIQQNPRVNAPSKQEDFS
ncbi:hypothetical protein [Arcanobacterium haemolyticum]